MNKKIYFDNAATSWPKPYYTINAVKEYFQGDGGGINRSNSHFSIEELRNCLKEYLGFNDKYEVAFVPSATIGMNIVINYFAEKNIKVLTTNMEHHCVYRPLNEYKVNYKIARVLQSDCKVEENIMLKELDEDTGGVIINHASNVVGAIFNYEKIASKIPKNVITVLDVSQTVGIEELNFKESQIDILVGGTHKHLYGLQGLGFIVFKKEIGLKPIYYGGTGMKSNIMFQPRIYPEWLEAGTYNSIALLVLKECINARNNEVRLREKQYEKQLLHYMCERLNNMEGIRLYMGEQDKRTSVVSFNVKNLDPTYVVGEYLKQKGIQVRTGLHCAPLVHDAINTRDTGTVRVSFSYINTIGEIDYFVLQLKNLLREMKCLNIH